MCSTKTDMCVKINGKSTHKGWKNEGWNIMRQTDRQIYLERGIKKSLEFDSFDSVCNVLIQCDKGKKISKTWWISFYRGKCNSQIDKFASKCTSDSKWSEMIAKLPQTMGGLYWTIWALKIQRELSISFIQNWRFFLTFSWEKLAAITYVRLNGYIISVSFEKLNNLFIVEYSLARISIIFVGRCAWWIVIFLHFFYSQGENKKNKTKQFLCSLFELTCVQMLVHHPMRKWST